MPVSEKKFVPVMITPFGQNGEIDFDGLAALIDFYLASGVKGFFTNCMSSEMFSISNNERLALTKQVVDYVKGAVPVVATGSFGHTIQDKANFTRKIFDTGVDAVIMITGHFAGVDDSDQILVANFDELLHLTGNIPLGMYECPAPYKRILKPVLFKTLLESDRFVYHKDTSIKTEYVGAKLKVIQELKNTALEFYDAHTPNATYSLQEGARGMSSISGNFYPELLVWMCDHATNPGKQEDIAWLQAELTRFDPVIHEAYPLSAKYFLQKRGVPVELISRSFVYSLTTDQHKKLDMLYEDFLNCCDRLAIKPVKCW